VTVDDAEFQSLLEQVRELHRLADESTHTSTRLHANVHARLSWRGAPTLPPEQEKLADDVLEVLEEPRLSSSQARKLHRAFFGRGPQHLRAPDSRAHTHAEWRVRDGCPVITFIGRGPGAEAGLCAARSWSLLSQL
jgi:hypothetical protein